MRNKIIIFLIMLMVTIPICAYISTLVHLNLVGGFTNISDIKVQTVMQSIVENNKHFQLYVLLQFLFILFIVLIVFVETTNVFESKLGNVTDKIKTPFVVGQGQHGTARWLKDNEYEKVFDKNILYENQYYIREHHEGIISAETFEKAQEILNKRIANRDTGRQKGNYSRKYAFSSRLYCGFCGQVMTRRNLYSSTPYSQKTWQCMNFVKLGKVHCPNCKTIKEQIIEKCFVDMYNIMYKNNKSVLNNFLNEVIKTLKENTSEKELNKFEMQKKELTLQNEKLLAFLVDGVISQDEYISKKQANINKIEKMEKEMKYLKDSMNAEDDIRKGLNKMKSLFENNEQLKEFDSNLFESLISRVIIGEEIDGVSYPYTITFLCKNNYENLGKPEIKTGDKPLIMEFISFQNFFSYEGAKDVDLRKKQNEEVRVKVRFDI